MNQELARTWFQDTMTQPQTEFIAVFSDGVTSSARCGFAALFAILAGGAHGTRSELGGGNLEAASRFGVG